MTAPTNWPPSCTVWADGVRMADGCKEGELPTEPVVLTGLRVTWGRPDALDQPEPATCTFTVLDQGGDPRVLDVLRLGTWIDVKAQATIYLDPTENQLTWDAGFEGAAVQLPPPGGVTEVNCRARVTSAQAHTGTRSVRLEPVAGAKDGTVRAIFPPAPYGGTTAWDMLPQTAAGQTWKFGGSLLLGSALGTAHVGARIRPAYFTRPSAGAYALLGPILTAVPGVAGWQDLVAEFEPPPGVWLGLAVELTPIGGARWNEMPVGTTWASLGATPLWQDAGAVWADDLVLLAPASGGVRSGTVFGGRVTDLTAHYDLELGGVVCDVIAQSPLAELDNRYLGATPYPKEHLHLRFDRVVKASGQAVTYKVDPTVANVNVTWRDVDNQPAGELLAELAQSVGGVLWSAHSDITGTYLWLEDVDQRPAVHILQMGVDGLVHIVLDQVVADGESFIELSACDVLLEPVEWVQTGEDDATQIGLSWMEQTKDDKGNEAPTQRTFEVTDTGLEAETGRRRIGVSTQLADYNEALLTANSLLSRASTPGWRIDGLHWSVGSAEQLDNATIQRMMAILDGVTRLGLGMLLTDLPAWTPNRGVDEPLFLEGGVFTNVDGAWELELLTSSALSQGKAQVRWKDLPVDTVTVRTNRVLNPRAVSTGAAGWITTRGFGTGGAGTYTFATPGTGPPDGSTSATVRRKTWTTASTASGNAGFEVNADGTNRFPVTAGETLTFSCWMRHTSVTAKTLTIRAQFWSATTGGTNLATYAGTNVPAPGGSPNTWYRVTLTVAAPATAAGVVVFPDLANVSDPGFAVGEIVDATQLMIEAGTTPGIFFDGATPDTVAGTVTVDNAWTGTADASTSTQTTTDTLSAWAWNEFGPEISWNDLQGVGMP